MWNKRLPARLRGRSARSSEGEGGLLVGLTAATTALLGALVAFLLRRGRRPSIARAVLDDPDQSTVIDENGAVRSVQAANLIMPSDELEKLWSPMSLERLARTYWRFLTRATLGIVRVKYSDEERTVCVLFRAFPLLTFQKPEYEMDEKRGVVRWRIEKGLLVAARGRGGDGFLQIDVERRGPDSEEKNCEVLHAEVEVSNFYPSIASNIGRWVYTETQSRIHVIVTHGFLRSLARLDLAESRVGRFAKAATAPRMDDVPDPPPSGERSPARERPEREPDKSSSAPGG